MVRNRLRVIGDLAKAVGSAYADNEVKIVALAMGKIYETLLTRRVLVAEDLGDYYRVPSRSARFKL